MADRDAQLGFMRRAAGLAAEGMAGGQGGPFGAVIVRDGAILGKGCNRVIASADPTAHAEVEAIRAACAKLGTFDLSGSDIYASCEPCPMCLGAILWARIGRIFYACNRGDAARIGFDDDQFYRELALDPADRAVPLVRLEVDEARAVFDAWQAKADKVAY